MNATKSIAEPLDSDNKLIDCGGAWLCPYLQGGATIVQIGGEIDACNGDQLSEIVFRYAATVSALVVDATAVDFCSLRGLRDLLDLDQHCHDSGIRWALIAGNPVRRLLEVTGVKSTLPVVDSVSTALQSLMIAGIGHGSGG
jgi:anti-sigma B factor antagonist